MRTFSRFAASLLALAALPAPALAATCTPQREAVTLALPGFASPGELVSPPRGTPARGLLVLFAGSDIADLDGAVIGTGDAIVSRPLLQVANRLACAGFVTLRYNKRYVTGPTAADRARFDALNGADFAADGRTALSFVRARPALAGLPLGLVGWSEGTTVAMAVGNGDPAVRALVLLAPVVDSPARVAQLQYARIGKPYLMRYATGGALDGALDADAIARADAGPAGVLAHLFVRMYRGFRPGERINPLLDTNRDGKISFAEADPIIASWYADDPNSGLGASSTARALKGIADAFTPATPPVLIVQGLNDSMIGPQAAQAFARGKPGQRLRLLTYPGLGHSLGRAATAQEDGLLPMAPRPLDDIVRWLEQRLHN